MPVQKGGMNATLERLRNLLPFLLRRPIHHHASGRGLVRVVGDSGRERRKLPRMGQPIAHLGARHRNSQKTTLQQPERPLDMASPPLRSSSAPKSAVLAFRTPALPTLNL